MSQQQPDYYSPPLGAPIPDQSNYQYAQQPIAVSPGMQYAQQPIAGSPGMQYAQQPIGTPSTQYAQQSNGTPGIQYAQPVGAPGNALQQPYYPAQSPAPVYQQMPVQEFKEPMAVYASEGLAQPAQPTVIRADGDQRRGLMGKFHQFEFCCGFIPLHTGAMIIAALMFIFYGWCGLALVTVSTYSGSSYYVVSLIIGVLYILVALFSGYGFGGIYREDVIWVNRFVRFFVVGSLIWLVLELAQMAIGLAYYADACRELSYYGYSCGFPWASWVVTLLIGVGIQYYFCCCLVSYQRVMTARVNDLEGGGVVEMH